MKLRLAIAVLAAAALAATAAWAAIPSGNLIQNPGAEDASMSLPGWSPTLDFQSLPYSTGGGYPTPSDPGCPDRGSNFFWAGNNASATATQDVDVAGAATEIDGGNVDATLSGYLGGFSTQDDQMKVEAIFLNGSLAELGRAQIGPVTAVDRGNTTSMLLRSTTADVPALTRTIRVVQTGTRLGGTSNDAYADCLSLTLAAGPTAVAVRGFSASRMGGHVVVSWRTATEAGALGFHVWRTGKDGISRRINAKLIAARHSGTARGGVYRVVDTKLRLGAAATYRLQVVDLSGKRTWSGRVSTPGR